MKTILKPLLMPGLLWVGVGSVLLLTQCSTTPSAADKSPVSLTKPEPAPMYHGHRLLEEKPVEMNGRHFIVRRYVVTESPLETVSETVEVK